MNNIQNSYYYLKHMKMNKKFLFIILFILFIFTIIISQFKFYNSLTLFGIYTSDQYYINVPIENSDTINNGEYIVIDDLKYKYKIINISKILVENNVNYQTFTIKIDLKIKENEIKKITFYYNEETIIKKIYRMFIN